MKITVEYELREQSTHEWAIVRQVTWYSDEGFEQSHSVKQFYPTQAEAQKFLDFILEGERLINAAWVIEKKRA